MRTVSLKVDLSMIYLCT